MAKKKQEKIEIRPDIVEALREYDEGMLENVLKGVVSVRSLSHDNDFYAILYKLDDELSAIVFNNGEVIEDSIFFETVEEFENERIGPTLL